MSSVRYITVKHGRVTLLCRPLVAPKNAYQAVGTFSDERELAKLLERLEKEK